MAASWEQDDIFPIIAEIIDRLSLTKSEFVTHEEITGSLLSDLLANSLIEKARVESDGSHTSSWIAHNMVAWFSQRISIGGSAWSDRFDRIQIAGKWAYRTKK